MVENTCRLVIVVLWDVSVYYWLQTERHDCRYGLFSKKGCMVPWAKNRNVRVTTKPFLN